jgi:hypothetical protein
MHNPEELLTLTQAAKAAPGRPSVNAVWRWCRKGVLSRSGENIRLQHVRVGSKIFTTATWMKEFGEQLARADTAHFDSKIPPLLPGRRRRREAPSQEKRREQIAQAQQELAAMGV